MKLELENKATASEATLWLHALHTRTGDAQALAALEPQPDQQDMESDLYQTLLSLP